MQTRRILLLTALTLVAGCRTVAPDERTVEDRLDNPLFAERYAETVVDALVELDIQKHPSMEDPDRKAYADEERRKWLDIAREARSRQRGALQGQFLSAVMFVTGDVLFADNTLYLGTQFEATATPQSRVYLTTVVDPRDTEFPDPTALDLGVLKTAYGEQSYAVPEVEDPLLYRTVVLWEPTLQILEGFAQLSP